MDCSSVVQLTLAIGHTRDQSIRPCSVCYRHGGKHLESASHAVGICRKLHLTQQELLQNTTSRYELPRWQTVEKDRTDFIRLDHVTSETRRRIFSMDCDSFILTQSISTIYYRGGCRPEVVVWSGSQHGMDWAS